MAKPRIPNQKKQYQLLNRRLAAYMAAVRRIYGELGSEAARVAASTGYDGKKPFAWKDYPRTKARVQQLQERFVSQLGSLIMSGTSDEWRRSNLHQDLIVDKVLKAYHTSRKDARNERYYRDNSEALQAFQQRKERGMNLSDKLLDQSRAYQEELQDVISAAIERGTDAITLSKQVSKYLQDFPSMQRDYKELYGKASKAQNCEYRSIRLARSEINMAYRTAEQTRWRQLDFVVGYEIKMSGAHPAHDVCDELAGKYPKDFKWNGWHPNCMCYEVPILKTEDEFYSENPGLRSWNEVADVPEAFNTWVGGNLDKIKAAEKHGTLPYFLQDNKKYVERAKEEFKEWEQFTSIIDVYKYAGIVPTETMRYVNWELEDLYAELTMSYGQQIDRLEEEVQKLEELLKRKLGERTRIVYMIKKGQIEKKMNQIVYEREHGEFTAKAMMHGFNSITQEGYNKSALRDFDLFAFDDKMVSVGDEYEIYWRLKDVRGSKSATITYQGVTENGETVSLERGFLITGKGDIVARHNLFELPESLQGKGISKKVMRACFEEYEKMGVTRVEVCANIDVGGLTWAKYGFYGERDEIEDIINYQHRRGRITDEEASDALAIVREYEDSVPMQLLGYAPYGGKLLLGTMWQGHINLKDAAQMDYLHKYLRMSK